MSTSGASSPRPLTAADAAALFALVEICDIAELGAPDYSMEDVVEDLGREGWRGWGVDGPDGSITAYCWVEHVPGKAYVEADVRVHPDADDALGHELLAFARGRAAARSPGLPVHVFTAAAAPRSRRWYDAAGGLVLRHYWRMTTDLSQAPAPAAPEPPAGVTLRHPGDDEAELRLLHDVMETAFEDHFGSTRSDFEEWLARQRAGSGADPGLWWMAHVDGEPAAALVGRAWPDTGWVQGLGTLRAFRGRGLGRLMLLTAFAEFRRRGYRTAGLSVDASNPTGAVALYESVGMRTAYEAVRYELPPG